jgi:hypothetical protein
MPGPRELVKYPTVAVQGANVMGEASGIEPIEVCGRTMPTHHRLKLLGRGNPG